MQAEIIKRLTKLQAILQREFEKEFGNNGFVRLDYDEEGNVDFRIHIRKLLWLQLSQSSPTE